MLSWAEFRHLRPDVAEAGHRLLYQFGVGLGFLATIRVDGGPRLHPMCPLVTEDALPGYLHPSPKRQDLHRDSRYALHCFPPDDNKDAFVVSGRAMPVADPGHRQQATAQFLAERQLVTAPGGFQAQDLFEFLLQRRSPSCRAVPQQRRLVAPEAFQHWDGQVEELVVVGPERGDRGLDGGHGRVPPRRVSCGRRVKERHLALGVERCTNECLSTSPTLTGTGMPSCPGAGRGSCLRRSRRGRRSRSFWDGGG